MSKLALIGNPAVRNYAVADRLWELISVVVPAKFRFKIVPASSPKEAIAAFRALKKDPDVVGFGIGEPWKWLLADQVDGREELIDLPVINMVYRDKSGALIGASTEPLAAQQALEATCNLYKRKTMLIISSEGNGLPLAYHMGYNLDKTTYLYDLSLDASKVPSDIVCLNSLSELSAYQYDIIVNTTPLGRYYFDKHIEAFTSPLDLETLAKISHKDTLVQETNYVPATTLLLQMARHLQLPVVTGDLMLVFEALESLKRYFGTTLDQGTQHMLVEEIKQYIAEFEVNILEQ